MIFLYPLFDCPSFLFKLTQVLWNLQPLPEKILVGPEGQFIITQVKVQDDKHLQFYLPIFFKKRLLGKRPDISSYSKDTKEINFHSYIRDSANDLLREKKERVRQREEGLPFLV